MSAIKSIPLLFCLSLFILVAGCSYLPSLEKGSDASENIGLNATAPSSNNLEQAAVIQNITTNKTAAQTIAKETVGCTDNSQCAWNEQCIDEGCNTIESLYDTNCDIKCNFNSVLVKTSDGETYTFDRGKGSYTAAGALSWKLLPGPDYCKGEDAQAIIPIELTKLNYGQIVGKNVVTITKGKPSSVITHPNISSIKFTLTATDLKEKCS